MKHEWIGWYDALHRVTASMARVGSRFSVEDADRWRRELDAASAKMRKLVDDERAKKTP